MGLANRCSFWSSMSVQRHSQPAPERVTAFAESLMKEMLASCGPIFITPGLMMYPEQMIDNGTYSLIDTGQRRILVTCHHVWQAFFDCRSKNPDAALCLHLGGR